MHLAQQAFRQGDVSSGYRDDMAMYLRGKRDHPGAPSSEVVKRCKSLPTLPATIHPDARKTAPLRSSAVVYIDPPYQNTTGYGHGLTRAEVMALAMKWSDAGADVYISEAEPIDLPGWYHVDITHCRQGQKRTFSKQQAEWLTCSKEPAWLPPQQGALF